MRSYLSILMVLPICLTLACARSTAPATGCEADADCKGEQRCYDNVCALGPKLLTSSPLNFGDTQVGIRTAGRLVITNGGDVALNISDFQVDPEDGSFIIALDALPITLKGKQSEEVPIFFRPSEEKAYNSELSFTSNHEGERPNAVQLVGTGLSNIICSPCNPPPEPECHLDNTSSISFLATSNDSCDNAANVCAYRMVETVCETACDPDTGLCPNVAPPVSTWDAGVAEEPFDAGPPPGACSHSILDGDVCDDGDLCTQNDICTDSECAGSPLCITLPNDLCISDTTVRHYTEITGCLQGICLYDYEDTACEFGCIFDHCRANHQLKIIQLHTSPGKMTFENKTLQGIFVPAETTTMSSGTRTLNIREVLSERP